MNGSGYVILGILFFGFISLLFYFFIIYNGLVALKENIKKAWANIDVILKQRHDELPKLISVCESYAEFEKGILTRLMEAREKYLRAGSVGKKAEASGEISMGLRDLFALAENYPDLKSNNNFMDLQHRISHLEESLADRREFYNDSVNNYNIRIQQIPDVLVAGFMNLRQAEMFKITAEERRDVNVKIKTPQF